MYYMPTYCLGPASTAAVGSSYKAHAAEWDFDRLKNEGARWLEDEAGLRAFRVQPPELERFQEALACFPGTHFFGNFAGTRYEADDADAWRHVRTCECVGEPFVDDSGREWLAVSVVADSFVTHQIRKMISTAALVAQGLLPLEYIHAAFERRIKSSTTKLPPHGLIFLRPYFQGSERANRLEKALAGEEVGKHVEAWLEALRKDVLRADAELCQWVRWLALTSNFLPNTRRKIAETLEAYAEQRRLRAQRVASKRAGAVQVAAIIASMGEPLWAGRHRDL